MAVVAATEAVAVAVAVAGAMAVSGNLQVGRQLHVRILPIPVPGHCLTAPWSRLFLIRSGLGCLGSLGCRPGMGVWWRC